MILQIFLLIIGIALSLIITGVILEDYAVQLVGLSFFLIAGAIFSNAPILGVNGGSIEYKTGETQLTNYSYLSDNTTIDYTIQTKTYNYNTYSNAFTRFIGVFMMIISILASTIIFTRLKQERENAL